MGLFSRNIAAQADIANAQHQLTERRCELLEFSLERCRDAVRAKGSPLTRTMVSAGSGLLAGMLLSGSGTPGRDDDAPKPVDPEPMREPPDEQSPPLHAPPHAQAVAPDGSDRLLQAVYAMGLSVASKTLFSAVVNPYLDQFDLKANPGGDSVGD